MKYIKIFLLLVPVYLVFQVLYSGFFLLRSKELARQSYTGDFVVGKGDDFLMLAAGDSVGAGVGASSFETSVVGRVAIEISKNRTVKLANKSVTGYKMHDLLNIRLPSRKQDLILLIIGSNNLFHFTDVHKFKSDTSKVLSLLAPRTKKLIIIGPGRIFDTDATPFFLRTVYKSVGNNYAKAMKDASSNYQNVVYINPFEANSPRKDYGETQAFDHFHPNDQGHLFWFDLIKPYLTK